MTDCSGEHIHDDDLYVQEVPTQSGGYNQCALCGGTDWKRPGMGITHTEGCTSEFRLEVALRVGWVVKREEAA